MNLKFFSFITALCLFLSLLSCESTPEKRSSAPINPAAYAADWMSFDKPQPERSPNDFDFYYKHCDVEARHPFPKGAAWDCTTP